MITKAFFVGHSLSPWQLLQGRPRPIARAKKPLPLRDETLDFSRIRCPLCKWQPKPSHRWFCAPCGLPEFYADGCGAHWNTFTTRGRCPGCSHQWRWTSCLNCEGWFLHEDWYENDSNKKQ